PSGGSRENADHAAVKLHRRAAGAGRNFEGRMQPGKRQVREARAQYANVDVRGAVKPPAPAGAAHEEGELRSRSGRLARQLAGHVLEIGPRCARVTNGKG